MPYRSEPFNAAHVDCQGTKQRPRLKTLVDTGAGPNVLSWDRLPEEWDMILKDSETQSISDCPWWTTRTWRRKGYVPDLQVWLAGTRLEVPCTVVNGLGYDDLTLGRDFLIKYDVLLDLPRRKLTIRNSHGRYRTTTDLRGGERNQLFGQAKNAGKH